MRFRYFALLGSAVLAVALMGCEIIGYDNPVTAGTSSWEHVETIDPVSGQPMVMTRTRTQANSLFGRVLSLFKGNPYLADVCVGGNRQLRIDWREAIGPTDSRRQISLSVDGGAAVNSQWTLSDSGRLSYTAAQAPRDALNQGGGVAVFRVVNAGGKPVVLVFNIRGYAAAVGRVTC